MAEISEISGRVEISAVGAKGEGLANGLALPFTLPGEVIEDGRLAVVSPDRVAPVCRHFTTCGGCAMQHATDRYLAEWKRGIVAQALRSQGLPEAISTIHVSPPQSRRRASLSGRRTKKTVQLGFHARRSDELVPLEECPLLRPEIVAAFDVLRQIVRLAATRKSVVRMTVSHSDAGLDLDVAGGRALDAADVTHLAEIAVDLARVSWDGEVILMHSPPIQRFGAAVVVPPPGAFLQATQEGEAALLAAVKRGVEGATRVCDLFAGCGTFSLPLAIDAEVHAVEFAPEMTAALEAGWRGAQGLKKMSVETRDLFRRPVLAHELKNFDTVVIDPPRAGAAAQVAELAKADLGRIAHVSCNPVTFARDVRVLVDAGYNLDWVEVVDQFRWSPHVELVGLLRKTHR